MFEVLQDVFNSVFLLVYGQEYHFINKKVEGSLLRFLKTIPATAGEDWLLNFTIFQFSYYDGMKTPFKKIELNWIYGPKALKRWNDRTNEQVYYADKFKTELGLKGEVPTLSVTIYREKEKLRFTDKYRRFIHCHELSLFTMESAICKDCVYYLNCQKH